jgi:hypothetical protein
MVVVRIRWSAGDTLGPPSNFADQLNHDDELGMFAEVEPQECWCGAMLKEPKSINENGSWSLTDLPAGHLPIFLN